MYFLVVGAISAFIGLSFPGGGASFVKRCKGFRMPFSSLSFSFSSYLVQLWRMLLLLVVVVVFFSCSRRERIESRKKEGGKSEFFCLSSLSLSLALDPRKKLQLLLLL